MKNSTQGAILILYYLNNLEGEMHLRKNERIKFGSKKAMELKRQPRLELCDDDISKWRVYINWVEKKRKEVKTYHKILSRKTFPYHTALSEAIRRGKNLNIPVVRLSRSWTRYTILWAPRKKSTPGQQKALENLLKAKS